MQYYAVKLCLGDLRMLTPPAVACMHSGGVRTCRSPSSSAQHLPAHDAVLLLASTANTGFGAQCSKHELPVASACIGNYAVTYRVVLSIVCCAGLLNLVYDAMPQDYITLVVTEFGAIPPTSVPVILREYRQEPTI